MNKIPTHLVWFRSDLRVHDNLALTAACNNQNARILSVFIATPGQWAIHEMAPRQASFLEEHLNDLQYSLARKGIPLLYMESDNFITQNFLIQKICQENKVTHLFYNYQYELNEHRRDKELEKMLNNIICQGFHDSVILPPGSVMTKNYKFYKIFTPFKKKWLNSLKKKIPSCILPPLIRKSGPLDKKLLSKLTLNYPKISFSTYLFASTEKEALKILRTFCKTSMSLYEKKRNYPSINCTSLLSAYLSLGILSPRQCLHELLFRHPNVLNGGIGSAWLNEIIWREFYRHLINFYPDLCKYKSFIPRLNNIYWKNNPLYFEAWKKGKTGYPIVDAGMRQLNATGWIHNRLRMIVASFLVKDLLVDWRIGERYFISQLIDGDLASNNGGWQWIASTGTDPVPYFRIFNPTTQGVIYDPDGKFTRRWLPELSMIPGKAIHMPWIWAKKFHVTLNYPYPIIDHKEARISTLLTYKKAYTI